MNNDLLGVLEVNRERLPAKAAKTVKYLEGRWAEHGSPTDRTTLEKFLDEAVTFCKKFELFCPPVLLKRLKQMQRGEWAPRG